jgi:subtilase family serine protease
MADSIEDKLAVLDAMNTSLGKITNVQVRLTLAGETALANQLDAHRKALLAQIEELQGQVADRWTVSAAALADKLQAANNDLQTRIRNIKNQVNVANNAIQIIGQIDGALKFLETVVP